MRRAALCSFPIILCGENNILEPLHLQRDEGEALAVKGGVIGVDRGREGGKGPHSVVAVFEEVVKLRRHEGRLH